MSRQSVQKREKEKQRLDKAKDKAENRRRPREDRPARAPGEEDPDIAGIVPGPQPIPE